MHDRGAQPPGAGGTPLEQSCPSCRQPLYFWLRLERAHQSESAHRVYRCEACNHFEWVEEPAGKRT
jgi:DNA-directed RNA polymerase subunit M/transcription elongation factor TFIIS